MWRSLVLVVITLCLAGLLVGCAGSPGLGLGGNQNPGNVSVDGGDDGVAPPTPVEPPPGPPAPPIF